MPRGVEAPSGVTVVRMQMTLFGADQHPITGKTQLQLGGFSEPPSRAAIRHRAVARDCSTLETVYLPYSFCFCAKRRRVWGRL